jgi:hypothetical protein
VEQESSGAVEKGRRSTAVYCSTVLLLNFGPGGPKLEQWSRRTVEQ